MSVFRFPTTFILTWKCLCLLKKVHIELSIDLLPNFQIFVLNSMFNTHLFWGKYDLFSGVNIWALFLSDWVLVNGEYLDLEVFSFGVNMLAWFF